MTNSVSPAKRRTYCTWSGSRVFKGLCQGSHSFFCERHSGKWQLWLKNSALFTVHLSSFSFVSIVYFCLPFVYFFDYFHWLFTYLRWYKIFFELSTVQFMLQLTKFNCVNLGACALCSRIIIDVNFLSHYYVIRNHLFFRCVVSLWLPNHIFPTYKNSELVNVLVENVAQQARSNRNVVAKAARVFFNWAWNHPETNYLKNEYFLHFNVILKADSSSK